MIFLLILSGILACSGNPADDVCQLKLSPPSVAVRYGDSFSANCSSTAAIEGIGWESPYGGIGLKEGVSFLPFHIKSVSAWELEPQCYASLLSDGTQCVKPLPVTVYKMPESVSISQHSSGGLTVVEGREFQMICDVVDVAPQDKLSIVLYIGNENYATVTFLAPGTFPVNKSEGFRVIAHRNYSETDVRCEARLNLGPAEQNPPPMSSPPYHLIVLYPPTFDKPENESVELLADEAVSLDCTAKGNPRPEYRWDFRDSVLQKNEQREDRGPILTPGTQDSGIYACTASNSQGTTTKYFSVVKASEDRTTFAAILGVFVCLGVLLGIAGFFFVTHNGTFSFNKNSYIRGQPTSSRPI